MLPRVLSKIFGVPEKDLRGVFQEQGALREQLSQLVREAIPSDIQERYREVVTQLADVDPLLAYQLSGRTELNSAVEIWRSKVDAGLGQLLASDEDRTVLAKFSPAVEREARERLLERLEEDIVSVAGRIGFLSRLRVKRLMSKERARLSIDSDDEFSGVARRLFEQAGLIVRQGS